MVSEETVKAEVKLSSQVSPATMLSKAEFEGLSHWIQHNETELWSWKTRILQDTFLTTQDHKETGFDLEWIKESVMLRGIKWIDLHQLLAVI